MPDHVIRDAPEHESADRTESACADHDHVRTFGPGRIDDRVSGGARPNEKGGIDPGCLGTFDDRPHG